MTMPEGETSEALRRHVIVVEPCPEYQVHVPDGHEAECMWALQGERGYVLLLLTFDREDRRWNISVENTWEAERQGFRYRLWHRDTIAAEARFQMFKSVFAGALSWHVRETPEIHELREMPDANEHIRKVRLTLQIGAKEVTDGTGE